MKKWVKTHGLALWFLAIIGLAIFLPILPDLEHRIIGDLAAQNAKDAYQNVWKFWWAKKNCLGFCGNMWQTDFQFYPFGTSLLFETWAYPSLFIFAPLMFLGIGAVTAYNLGLIFAILASLLGAYFLIFYLTKSQLASTLGATLYGISPFVIGHMMDGQLNLVNVQYSPLFLLNRDSESGFR